MVSEHNIPVTVSPGEQCSRGNCNENHVTLHEIPIWFRFNLRVVWWETMSWHLIVSAYVNLASDTPPERWMLYIIRTNIVFASVSGSGTVMLQRLELECVNWRLNSHSCRSLLCLRMISVTAGVRTAGVRAGRHLRLRIQSWFSCNENECGR